MLNWIITFFVLALVAGGLGFSGLANTFGGAAEFLTGIFVIFIVGGIILSIIGYSSFRGRK